MYAYLFKVYSLCLLTFHLYFVLKYKYHCNGAFFKSKLCHHYSLKLRKVTKLSGNVNDIAVKQNTMN